MPIVHIHLLKGRSCGQKANLAREVSRCVSQELNVEAGSVRVLLHEVDPADWFVGGVGKAAIRHSHGKPD